jgi:hypothetical protein
MAGQKIEIMETSKLTLENDGVMLPSALGFDQNQNNSLRFIAGYAGNNRVGTVSNLLLPCIEECALSHRPGPHPHLV